MILLIKSRFGSAGWICITLLRQFVNTLLSHALLKLKFWHPSYIQAGNWVQVTHKSHLLFPWIPFGSFQKGSQGILRKTQDRGRFVSDTTAEAGRITEFRVAKVWLCGWILPERYLKHWLHAELPLLTWEHLQNPARTSCERAAAGS